MLAHAPPPHPESAANQPPERSGAPTAPAIASHHVSGVLVLRPIGRLGRDSIDRLRRLVRAADAPVVIQLDDCVLVAPSAFDRLQTEVEDHAIELCIVCRRLTCRRLLARVGITERFSFFQQLEDALQARVMAAAGYGDGWRSPPS